MPTRPRGRISRFTVMAMLQAARAHRLGLALDSAYSWGLNRAIFFAAAKRGFRGGGATAGGEAPAAKGPPSAEEFFLGDEKAYRDPNRRELAFTIGGETQTPADFARQVASRFGSEGHFRAAWTEASAIVAGFDEATLRSGHRFFSDVYRPRRDELSQAWTERYGPSGASGTAGPVSSRGRS